jgi:hypothetical protein
MGRARQRQIESRLAQLRGRPLEINQGLAMGAGSLRLVFFLWVRAACPLRAGVSWTAQYGLVSTLALERPVAKAVGERCHVIRR